VKVFVAGASGVIGRRLVPMLVEAGHEVVGTTRTPEKADLVRGMGASAAVVDALDSSALREAVVSARPEAIVNQLTDLPASYNPRRMGEMVGPTNELRVSSTRTLVEAARELDSPRLVWQSICFSYAAEGDWVKTEEAPLARPGELFGAAAGALAEMEGAVVDAGGLVLRYGQFYGPGTYYARAGSIAWAVRKRQFPIVGDGQGHFSFIHVDDAASATVAALERGPAGIYNICDDEPAPLREWLPVYAAALGAKPPRRAPALIARLFAGKDAAAGATLMRGASNAKARRELDWAPKYPSWRQGFAADLGGG
jgi:nucleoside-diphosphate-sugar epimerase